MRFYLVRRDRMVKKYMCDNPKCPDYITREGMPKKNAIIGFQVCSMQKFDACSQECRDAITAVERRICE
jgi:hypothetical protein